MTFLVVAGGVVAIGLGQDTATDEGSLNSAAVERPDNGVQGESAAVGAIIPPEWLHGVQLRPGSELGLLPDEVEPYFRILAHTRKLDARQLSDAERQLRLDRIDEYQQRMIENVNEKAGDDETTRELLMQTLDKRITEYRKDPFSYPLVRDTFNQPEACHGKVVSFTGHARRSRTYPAGDNAYGIDDLHELFLFDEAGNGYPVVVVYTEPPEGFPTNTPDDQIIDGVSVRGYFFKLYAYESQDGYRAVPMILADRVTWAPTVFPERKFPKWGYYLVVGLGIAILFLIFRGNRKTEAELQRIRDRVSSHEDNPFASTDDSDSKDLTP